MKRFLLMLASVLALGMAAPAVAQALGPNDAFIDQIGATDVQTGVATRGNRSDVGQISDSAADAPPSATGKLNRSSRTRAADEQAYVLQLGPHGLGRKDAPAAEVGEGKTIQDHGLGSNAAEVAKGGKGNLNNSTSTQSRPNMQMAPNRAQLIPAPLSPGSRAQGGQVGVGISPRVSSGMAETPERPTEAR